MVYKEKDGSRGGERLADLETHLFSIFEFRTQLTVQQVLVNCARVLLSCLVLTKKNVKTLFMFRQLRTSVTLHSKLHQKHFFTKHIYLNCQQKSLKHEQKQKIKTLQRVTLRPKKTVNPQAQRERERTHHAIQKKQRKQSHMAKALEYLPIMHIFQK